MSMYSMVQLENWQQNGITTNFFKKMYAKPRLGIHFSYFDLTILASTGLK